VTISGALAIHGSAAAFKLLASDPRLETIFTYTIKVLSYNCRYFYSIAKRLKIDDERTPIHGRIKM